MFVAPIIKSPHTNGFPSKIGKFSSHFDISKCSFNEPTLFIMFARYEIIAIFPTSYGLLGSILSTDGKLSLSKSKEIGIPSAGQIEGTFSFIKSSREILRFFFLVAICFHNFLSGFSFLSLFAFSRIKSLFLILYSRIYAAYSDFGLQTPFLCFLSILLLDWQLLHILGKRPSLGVKSLSSFMVLHFIHFFTGFTLMVKTVSPVYQVCVRMQ